MDLGLLQIELGKKYDDNIIDFSSSTTGIKDYINVYISSRNISKKNIFGNIKMIDDDLILNLGIFEDLKPSIELFEAINNFNMNFSNYKMVLVTSLGVPYLDIIYKFKDISSLEYIIEEFDMVISDLVDDDMINAIKRVIYTDYDEYLLDKLANTFNNICFAKHENKYKYINNKISQSYVLCEYHKEDELLSIINILLINTIDKERMISEFEEVLKEYPTIKLTSKVILDTLIEVTINTSNVIYTNSNQEFEEKLINGIALLSDNKLLDKLSEIVLKYHKIPNITLDEINYNSLSKMLSEKFSFIKFKSYPNIPNKISLFNNSIHKNKPIDGEYGIVDNKVYVEFFIHMDNEYLIDKVDEYNQNTTFTKILLRDYFNDKFFVLKMEYELLELNNIKALEILVMQINALLSIIM